MKKLVLFLLVALLSVSSYAAEFSDTGAYDWASEAIEELAAKGIINGMSEGIFYPEGSVTYEQLAKMAVLSFGSEEKLPEAPTFEDAAEDRWSYEYIEKAKNWFSAKNGKFNPDANAPRWEVAGVVVRALGLKAENLAVFSDSDDMTEEMLEIAAAAQEYGIMTGYPDGTFAPMKDVSRAETAVILHRAMSLETEDEETQKPEEAPVPDETPETEETPEENLQPEEELDVRMDFFVITKAVNSLSESGDATVKLTGYNNSAEVDFTCERAVLYDINGKMNETETFGAGDVVMAIRDITNNVRAITKVFDAEKAYEGNNIINHYTGVKVAHKGYLSYSFGLVRNISSKAMTVVLNDTVSTADSANTAMWAINDDTNYYEYNPNKKKVTLAEKGDITADKTPSENLYTDDGSFVFVLCRDNIASDVLIMYNK